MKARQKKQGCAEPDRPDLTGGNLTSPGLWGPPSRTGWLDLINRGVASTENERFGLAAATRAWPCVCCVILSYCDWRGIWPRGFARSASDSGKTGRARLLGELCKGIRSEYITSWKLPWRLVTGCHTQFSAINSIHLFHSQPNKNTPIHHFLSSYQNKSCGLSLFVSVFPHSFTSRESPDRAFFRPISGCILVCRQGRGIEHKPRSLRSREGKDMEKDG